MILNWNFPRRKMWIILVAASTDMSKPNWVNLMDRVEQCAIAFWRESQISRKENDVNKRNSKGLVVDQLIILWKIKTHFFVWTFFLHFLLCYSTSAADDTNLIWVKFNAKSRTPSRIKEYFENCMFSTEKKAMLFSSSANSLTPRVKKQLLYF